MSLNFCNSFCIILLSVSSADLILVLKVTGIKYSWGSITPVAQAASIEQVQGKDEEAILRVIETHR